jgi:tetratricopeptide (TPR) repeat protein
MNQLRVACILLAASGLALRSNAQEAPVGDAPITPALSPSTQVLEPATNADDALKRARQAIKKAEERGTDATTQLDIAKAYLQQADRFDANDAVIEYLYARMNILVGYRREGFKKIDDYVLTAEGRNDWEAYKILGDLHLQAKYYVMAEDKYKIALRLAPNEPSIFIGLARVATKRSLRQDALEYAAKAVELNPRDAEAHEIHAAALATLSRFDLAKAAIQKAIDQTQSELSQDLGNRSKLDLFQKRLETLQQVLKAIIDRDPKAATAYVELHKCMNLQIQARNLADEQSSFEVLKQGVEKTRPDTPSDLMFEYALQASKFGRTQDAITLLEDHLKDHSSDDKAKEMLEMLRVKAATPQTPAFTTDIR